MSRRFWITLLLLAMVAACIVATFAIRGRLGPPPIRSITIETPALYLPAAPPEGHYGDPEEGARYEENRHRIGIELSRRKEKGPIHCASLRVRSDAAYEKSPSWRSN